jgi:hypothetical protein
MLLEHTRRYNEDVVEELKLNRHGIYKMFPS